MHDDELHRFKSDIHFVHYALERYGYQRDRRKSSRSSHVLRHPGNDDKIIVRKEADGHWTYFSVRDDRDHGTIVDFVKGRSRCRSLGEVRKELRQWLGTARPEVLHELPETTTTPPRDGRAVAEAFAAAASPRSSAYLRSRGIRGETLVHRRFAGTWRQDARGNVLFAHRDELGELTGFEIKNRSFTGFATGGTKTAWQSAAFASDRALVITESAIDALSYYQLHPQSAPFSRYLSTAGAPSCRQFALLDSLFAKLPGASIVLAAVDSDEAGAKLANRIKDLATAHAHVSFLRDSPARDKDWNEVLQRLERAR
jgi:hypothetical protein